MIGRFFYILNKYPHSKYLTFKVLRRAIKKHKEEFKSHRKLDTFPGGHTLLTAALAKGQWDAAILMMKYGASPNRKNARGEHPFDILHGQSHVLTDEQGKTQHINETIEGDIEVSKCMVLCGLKLRNPAFIEKMVRLEDQELTGMLRARGAAVDAVADEQEEEDDEEEESSPTSPNNVVFP